MRAFALPAGDRARPEFLFGEASRRHVLHLALTAGGDERLRIDPKTSRNRYGTPPGLALDEVWFASSTASAISPRGFEAASLRLDAVLDAEAGGSAGDWFEQIRDRLRTLFGTPGTEVILAGSGTEAELIVLSLATTLLGPAITNIVLAPTETGSGVGMAAGGRHFLGSASCAPEVARGARLPGFETFDLAVEGVDIRNPAGEPVAADDLDLAVVARAEAALESGRDVLVHCLDASKTGLQGLSRATAAALRANAGDRLLVVVDACQLRCSAEEIRRDLEAGFMVMVTGSKFAGGPPFAGALLVPPCLSDRLARIPLPAGLAAYSSWHDWPRRLRARLEGPLTQEANLGLALRWEAALAELERYAALDPALRNAVKTRFAAEVRGHVARTPGLRSVRGGEPDAGRLQTVFPLVTLGRDGRPVPAEPLHRALRTASSVPGLNGTTGIFHVGQPVAVGAEAALRICLGAPLVVDVGCRVAAGYAFEDAFEPIASDLDALMAKWSFLRDHPAALAAPQG